MPNIQEIVAYNASYLPSNATLPVTFNWNIVPSSAGIISPNASSKNITIQWKQLGTHTLNLTSVNCGGVVKNSSRSISVVDTIPIVYEVFKCSNPSIREKALMTNYLGLAVNTTITLSSDGECYYIGGTVQEATTNVITGLGCNCNSSTPSSVPMVYEVFKCSDGTREKALMTGYPGLTNSDIVRITPNSECYRVSRVIQEATTNTIVSLNDSTCNCGSNPPPSSSTPSSSTPSAGTPSVSCNYYSIQNTSSNIYNYTYPTLNGTLSGTLLGNNTVNICTSGGISSIQQTNTSAPIVTLQGVTLIGTSTCSCSTSPSAGTPSAGTPSVVTPSSCGCTCVTLNASNTSQEAVFSITYCDNSTSNYTISAGGTSGQVCAKAYNVISNGYTTSCSTNCCPTPSVTPSAGVPSVSVPSAGTPSTGTPTVGTPSAIPVTYYQLSLCGGEQFIWTTNNPNNVNTQRYILYGSPNKYYTWEGTSNQFTTPPSDLYESVEKLIGFTGCP